MIGLHNQEGYICSPLFLSVKEMVVIYNRGVQELI